MASTRAPATHCVHRWAHNEDPNKTGKTRNVRFDGMSLYHWSTVIAVKYPKQKTVVVAGDGIRNSASTCCEKQRCVNALPPGWNVIYVDCFRPGYAGETSHGHELESLRGLRKCHDAMKKELKRKAKIVTSSRRGASRRGASMAVARQRIWNVLRVRVDVLAEFLHRKPVNEADYFTAEEREVIAESVRTHDAQRALQDQRNEARRQRQRLAVEAQLAKLAAEETADAELWRRHEYRAQRMHWYGTYVRLSRGGDCVETSKGVVVPIADALRLFRMCSLVKARGEAVTVFSDLAVPTIGGYRVNAVEATGNARIGCHYLKFEEMERCFKVAEQRRLVQAEEIEMGVRA